MNILKQKTKCTAKCSNILSYFGSVEDNIEGALQEVGTGGERESERKTILFYKERGENPRLSYICNGSCRM